MSLAIRLGRALPASLRLRFLGEMSLVSVVAQEGIDDNAVWHDLDKPSPSATELPNSDLVKLVGKPAAARCENLESIKELLPHLFEVR
jgi:hypothetical protein